MAFDWLDFHSKIRKELSSDPGTFDSHFVQLKTAAHINDRRAVFAFDLSPRGQHNSSLFLGAPHLRVIAATGALSVLGAFGKDLEARVVGQEVLVSTNNEAILYHEAKSYAAVKKMINTGKLRILDDRGTYTRASDLLKQFGRIVTTHRPSDQSEWDRIRRYLAEGQCYRISDTADGIITYSNK
jgi:hypothetical protein